MSNISRQVLISLIKRAAEDIVATRDQKWGRAFATTLEKAVVRIRLSVGYREGSDPILVPPGAENDTPAVIQALRYAARRAEPVPAQTLADHFGISADSAAALLAILAEKRTSDLRFFVATAGGKEYKIALADLPEEDWDE